MRRNDEGFIIMNCFFLSAPILMDLFPPIVPVLYLYGELNIYAIEFAYKRSSNKVF